MLQIFQSVLGTNERVFSKCERGSWICLQYVGVSLRNGFKYAGNLLIVWFVFKACAEYTLEEKGDE